MSDVSGPFDEQALLLEQLNASVQQARETVEAGRLAVEARINQAEEDERKRKEAAEETNTRKNRNTLIIASLISLVGVIFGITNKLAADSANAAAEKAQVAADTANEALVIIEEERQARTVGACEAARERALASLDKDRAHIQDVQADVDLFAGLLAASSGGNPDGIALAEAYVAEKAQIIRDIEANQDPVRICTDEAIAAFFESGGIEGIEPPVDLSPEP